MALQATCIIIAELETHWNFIHVGHLKSIMSTSEIHLIGKKKRIPILDILGYLKNTIKIPNLAK